MCQENAGVNMEEAGEDGVAGGFRRIRDEYVKACAF